VNKTISYKGLCCISLARDILQFKIVAGSDWQLVSIWCLLIIPSQNGKLCLMSSLLHRWMGKVRLCHSETIETAWSSYIN